MKIVLAKPYNKSDHIQPSLGLGYLATAVRSRHDVKLVDGIKERMSVDKLRRFLKEEKPDVLGLQCYTFDVGYIREALAVAKSVRKDMVTVIGGPHPSTLPADMFDRAGSNLDYAFAGEAEVGFSRLADAIEAGEKDLSSINGLIWRDGANLITNPRSWVDDLDSLGAPAWDIIKPEKYPEAQHGAFFKKFPIAPIMVTRGCPFSCTFCAGNLVSGKKIRKRSIGHVLWEMNYLYRNHGIREFHIIDDNFTMDAAYVKEFLRRLKALNLDISWAVPNGVRMDTLDEEMLRLMKETGLYMISLGIETGSDRVLRMMRKATNISKIRKCVSMIQEAGIDIAGFFILGFPGETEMSIKKTICFARQLGIERANFFTYLPFPGTQSYRELEARGELKDVDWESFYFMNAAYVPQGLNRKQLKDLQRLAFARFYLRSRVVLYHIKEIKSLRHLMFLTRRFLNWIA